VIQFFPRSEGGCTGEHLFERSEAYNAACDLVNAFAYYTARYLLIFWEIGLENEGEDAIMGVEKERETK